MEGWSNVGQECAARDEADAEITHDLVFRTHWMGTAEPVQMTPALGEELRLLVEVPP